MVRHVKDTPAAWKAMLAISLAAGALLWHLLACTDSPMAFSPSGEDLVFVTGEPVPFGEAKPEKGKNMYRLMVLRGGKELRVIEQTKDEILTAPAYSPDGARVCYLRIGLRSREEVEAADKRVEDRKQQWEKLWRARKEGDDLFGQEDLTLPPAKDAVEMVKYAVTGEPLPAMLVVRDAKTWEVVSTMRVDFSAGEYGGETLGWVYSLIRPQYSPDGKWVHFWDTQAAVAVDPTAKKRCILAAPARIPILSPDGKMLAVYMEKSIGLVSTDGQTAIYRRVEGEVSPLGLAWMDKETLAVLVGVSSEKEGQKRQWKLHLLKTDGRIARTVELKVPELELKEGFLELALAPNGRHMVLCSGGDVLFMQPDGKVLKHWKSDKNTGMFRPTFTPDSKRVAFKYLLTEKEDRLLATAVVFFTPEGEEVARVALPQAEAPASRPAGEGS